MSSFVYGQFVDDFTDANFTSNPIWSGDAPQWSAASTVLDLNGPAGVPGTYYLSTPSAAIFNGSWEFHVKVDFTPSGSTFVDAYLVSDIPLTSTAGAVNGYMVRISTSGLARFYVVNNGTPTVLITGTTVVGTAATGMNVKVTRSPAGLWSMFLDYTTGNGSNYVAQGVPVTNTVHTISNYFGISTTYIANRQTWCHFDNFNVSGTAFPDVTPPTVLSVVPQSTTTALVTFSEFVKVGALTPSNYVLRNGMAPATSAGYGVDSAHVNIGFTLPTQFLNCQQDSVVVQNVQDKAANTMVTDTVASVYFVPGTAAWKSVVLNEIMAAPSGSTCIPQVEYVEIYNRSNFPVDLQNWKVFNGSALTISATSYPLCPGEYAILCSPTSATSFTGYPRVIGVPSFGALTNSGEPLSLRSNTNVLVDTFAYASAATAIAWELVNPADTCSSTWILSTNPCGGTPTALNSVNNNTPDTTPPSIASVAVTGTNSIAVCFTEPVASGAGTVGNYVVTPPLGGIASVVVAPGNICVTVTFNLPIDTFVVHSLIVNNLQDCHLNQAPDTADFMISGNVPFRAVIINEILFNPDPGTALPDTEYVELYNRSNFPVDLSGWRFRDRGVTVHTLGPYILLPGEFVLLVDLAETLAYSGIPLIGIPSFPALDDTGDSLSLRDQFNNPVDVVEYDDTWYRDPVKQSSGGWSIELINPNDTCNADSNWRASVAAIGGTPGLVNSVLNTTPDTTPPAIASINVTGSNTLMVCFTEGLALGFAATNTNYNVPGLGFASTATPIPPNYSCVDLVFGTAIGTGVVYTLTASNLEDCAGNTAPSSGNFLVSGQAQRRDLIMNEIFFDTTGQTALPHVPYVELYNRSTTPYDLAGWKFKDYAGTMKTLGSYILLPGEYVILCKASLAGAFAGLPVLGLSSWPSLNVTGDQLGLRDAFFNLIDTVEYDVSWYQNPTKASDGGWSIELKNPNDSCNTASNWEASTNVNGGTPGALNSVFSVIPDLVAPHIVSVTPTGPNSVQVCFDEGLEATTANTFGNYTVSPSLGSITNAVLVTPGNSCVDLTFGGTIQLDVLYTLTATGVEDCSGNDTVTTGNFILNGPASFRSLLFNEIYADTSPTVALAPVEYLEIYNPSATAWDLNGWTLHNGGARLIGSYVLLPGEYVILVDDGDVSAVSGIPNVAVVSWPGLSNAGDQIGLHDPNGILVDTVAYDMSWYQNAIKEDGGWSLELINPTDTCAMLGNWIASNDSSGGTPGRVNSVYSNAPDTLPPTMLGITVIDSNHIEVCFDETMDLGTLLTATNYFVDSMGSFAVSAVVSGFGNACVTLLLPQTIDTGTVYGLTVTNMRDCKGNLAGPLTGQFVLGGNANRYQIVINEIYPDETPVIGTLPEAEFVELYNNGPNVVSIKDWTITDRSSTGTFPAFNLFPGRFVILCASGDVADFGAFGDAIAVASMPGLNQDGDSLEIYDATGQLMDFAYYDKSWYQDAAKEDGGWSMERKDPAYPCANGGNWQASTDPNGATPGEVNSGLGTFSDVEPPTVIDAIATSRSTVRLSFSELMDGNSLLNAIYTLSPGIGQATAVTVNGTLPFSVDLAFGNLMDTNVVYCIAVTGVQDCPGNTILAPNSLCFGIAAPVAQGDLIINEILFNPYTGGSDYVELYNNSDKIIDLSEVWIGEADPLTHALIDSGKVSSLPKIMLPRTYIALTPDPDFQIETYQPIDPAAIFKMSSLPAYEDTEGECVIYTDSQEELDRLSYLDDWHFPNLDDKNGVSLERLDFNRTTQNQDNWHSAATTALYGTPGYKNSEILVPEGDAEVWLQPETFSPDQDGFEDIIAVNYHFLEPDWNVRVMVMDNKGRPVRILKENTLVGTEPGTFIWDGTTDGLHKADVGVYVILLEAMNPVLGEKKHFKLGCVLAAKL